MGILDELWYGNVSPCERDFEKGSKYSELLGYIVRHEEDLQKRLNDEENEIEVFGKILIAVIIQDALDTKEDGDGNP